MKEVAAAPLILNFAPTGMVPSRQMTPHLPVQPCEIIAAVGRAARIGISMVHLHARDKQGLPTYRKEIYAEIISGIRAETPDLVIGVSCSGRDFPAFAQRSEVLMLDGDLKPVFASLTPSSLNFARRRA